MKKITLLNLDNTPLFTGTRSDVKVFIKTKRLKQGTYSLTENYVEKVIIPASDDVNFLTKAETTEGFFNRIF